MTVYKYGTFQIKERTMAVEQTIARTMPYRLTSEALTTFVSFDVAESPTAPGQ